MIGGKLGVEVDQNLDPILSGTLVISNVTLVQGRDLFKWGKDFTLLRTTVAAGPVPIAMSGGVGIGIGLSMLPLTFGASIGVSNFRPLSASVQVPDFFARADLNTGLRMAASLKPWFSIGVGIAGIASAGLALQGEAGLNVDLNINPYAEIKGQGGVYSGKLGIGIDIVGSGQLSLSPQVYAELLSKKWTYDLTQLTHDLGKLFSFGYNFSLPFGDSPGAPQEGGGGAAPPKQAPATSRKIAGHKTAPARDPATTGAPNRPGPVKGGPDANQANNDSKESSKREGPMGDLMRKIDAIQEWGAKVGRIAKVAGPLVSALMFVATLGLPAGLLVAVGYLAYKFAVGDLSFALITEAAKDVWAIIQEIDLSAITKLLPEWMVTLWNRIKGKSVDDLLCDMIDWIADTLTGWFPAAGGIIDVIRDEGKNAVRAMARLVRCIVNGTMPSFDDFITIARALGGGIAIAVASYLARAAGRAVANAGRAVVNFVASLW
jgi:hypothetical protein